MSRPFSFYVCRALWRQLAQLHLEGLPRVNPRRPRFYTDLADVRITRHGWGFTVGTSERPDPRFRLYRYRRIVHVAWVRARGFRVLWCPRGHGNYWYEAMETDSAREVMNAVLATLRAW